MARRGQPVWVDSARTKTANDVSSLEECEALIKRFARDINEIHAKIRTTAETKAVEQMKRALFYRDLGLKQLKARLQQLSPNT